MKAPTPFVLMADMPANPLDEQDLSDYCDLGFNTFIMTEDNHIDLVKEELLSDDYKTSLNRLGEHGLDVFIRNMYNDVDYFQNPKKDKLGSNYGTPYVLTRRNITTEFTAFPQIKGFYMADEPFMEAPKGKEAYTDFPKIKKLVDWKNHYYPSLYFHVNHVPSSSYDHFDLAHGVTYRDFLQAYIEQILRPLTGGGRSLCLDHYPLAHNEEITKDYLEDLLAGASLVHQNNLAHPECPIDFGLCIQTFRYLSPIGEGLQRDIVSVDEITFQLFLGLALGAKVYEYFCYHSSERFDCFGMIRGKDHRVYDLTKKANASFVRYLDALKGYSFKETAVCESGHHLSKRGEEEPSLKVLEGKLIVGSYESNGKKAYVLCPFGDPMNKGGSVVSITGTNGLHLYSSASGMEPLLINALRIDCGEAVILFA